MYAPNADDTKFIRRNATTPAAKLYLTLLLKTVLRLGYFPMLHEIPPAIVSFVGKKVGARSITARDLFKEERRHHSRVRCMEAIRAYTKIKPITGDTHTAILNAATEAAQTKQELADIINVIIEELVRQRFELPAFSTLNRKALAVRSEINDRYFKTLADPLPLAVLSRFDAMLLPAPQQSMSG